MSPPTYDRRRPAPASYTPDVVPPRQDDGQGHTVRCPSCGYTLRGVRLRGDCDFTLHCREKVKRTPDPCSRDRRMRWERCGAVLRIRRAGAIVSVIVQREEGMT